MPQRQNFPQSLVTVLGFGNHQPGQKGAEGQRQSGLRGQPGRAHAQQDKGQQKNLPVPRGNHLAEQPGNNEPGAQQSHPHDQNGLARHQGNFLHARRFAGQKGREERHGHDAQVLKDQYPQRHLPVRAVQLAAFRKQFQDNRRAAQRHQHPQKDRLFPGRQYRQSNQRHQHHRAGDLQPAAQPQRSPHAKQLRQGQFNPDGKQQQSNAKLCQNLDLLRPFNPAQTMRADQRSRRQITDDGRQPQAAEDYNNTDCQPEDHNQVF